MSAHITAGLFVLVFAMVSPVTAAAQFPPGSGAGTPHTAAEQRGEAHYVQTCILCHGPTTGQARALELGAPDFIGLFKRPEITEEYVRQMIAVGIPRLMPGYQYSYTPDELADLIAYLKIR